MLKKNSRLGFLIRRVIWFFRDTRIPQCDDSVRIHPTASFEGAVENVTLEKGVVIDAYARIFCHKKGRIVVGEGSYIGPNVILHTGKKGGEIAIGSRSTIQAFGVIYGHGGCQIGDGVRVAAHVVMVPANHKFANVDQPIHEQGLDMQGIKVESNVWIGAGSLILDGVNIGGGTVVGAGSLVNKSLPPNVVAVGLPARSISKRTPLDGDRMD